MATACCIILMELLYGFDFSVFGFLVCTAILGFGMKFSFLSGINITLKTVALMLVGMEIEFGNISRAGKSDNYAVWISILSFLFLCRYLPGNLNGTIKKSCSFRKSRAIKWYFSYWLASNISSKLTTIQLTMTSIVLDFKSNACVFMLIWLITSDLLYSLPVIKELFSKKLRKRCSSGV
jgi:hypothetical protein